MTSPAPFRVQSVADGIYACVPSDGTANAGFVVGENGVVVIDTLTTPSQARALLASVREVSQAPIQYVVNTHWHGDHTFGNQYFRPARVVAHETCREDLMAGWESTHALLARLYPPLKDELEQVSMDLPDLTFSDSVTIHAGRPPVELRYLGPAHTRGDIVVLLPEQGVLFAGDLAFHGYIPSMQDSYPSRWIDVIDEVAGIGMATVVPGHGPVGGPVDLLETRDCLRHIVEAARRGFTAGRSPEATLEGLSMGRFTSWGRQADRLPPGVRRAYQELGGGLAPQVRRLVDVEQASAAPGHQHDFPQG